MLYLSQASVKQATKRFNLSCSAAAKRVGKRRSAFYHPCLSLLTLLQDRINVCDKTRNRIAIQLVLKAMLQDKLDLFVAYFTRRTLQLQSRLY